MIEYYKLKEIRNNEEKIFALRILRAGDSERIENYSASDGWTYSGFSNKEEMLRIANLFEYTIMYSLEEATPEEITKIITMQELVD